MASILSIILVYFLKLTTRKFTCKFLHLTLPILLPALLLILLPDLRLSNLELYRIVIDRCAELTFKEKNVGNIFFIATLTYAQSVSGITIRFCLGILYIP